MREIIGIIIIGISLAIMPFNLCAQVDEDKLDLWNRPSTASAKPASGGVASCVLVGV